MSQVSRIVFSIVKMEKAIVWIVKIVVNEDDDEDKADYDGYEDDNARNCLPLCANF